jgi:hypothetical protein
MMHERGKSDSAVRAVKPANKAISGRNAGDGARPRRHNAGAALQLLCRASSRASSSIGEQGAHAEPIE